MPKEIMKINRDIVLDLFLERLLREGAGFKRVERFGQVITAMRFVSYVETMGRLEPVT